MEQKNKHLGIALILIGGIMVMNHYGMISFRVWNLWPLILIYLGLKAERDYFIGYSGSRSLLSGATLTIYGLYFLANGFLSHRVAGLLWPMFILGPALGFLQMAYYGHQPKKNYRVGTILSLISFAFFIDQLSTIRFNVALYFGLIAVGLLLIAKNKSPKSDDYEEETYDEDDERY